MSKIGDIFLRYQSENICTILLEADLSFFVDTTDRQYSLDSKGSKRRTNDTRKFEKNIKK
ncbi:3850_t:CDS:2 [Rhizophagus irregularis]|nr:3850_t:CDS:2 [Rhizophagus irregularis]